MGVCFSLISCHTFLYKWHPSNQPGTYWESTDSSISFYVWEENDSDPYYERMKQFYANGEGFACTFGGRGTLTYNGVIYDVLFNVGDYEDLAFYSVDVLDLTMDKIIESYCPDEPESAGVVYQQEIKKYCLLYLDLRIINKYRCIATVSDYLPEVMINLIDWEGKIDLRRIDQN